MEFIKYFEVKLEFYYTVNEWSNRKTPLIVTLIIT